MRRLAFFALCLALAGCREVRVKEYAQGTTTAVGGNQVIVVRDQRVLGELGIKQPIRFSKEFAVVLLMGPHTVPGYRQRIESIRANADRVRIVAFEKAPFEGDGPAGTSYRTYTLWIVPNSVYTVGSAVDVVTPSGEPIATTTLR